MRKHLAIAFATCLIGCAEDPPPIADTTPDIEEPVPVASPKPTGGDGGGLAAATPTPALDEPDADAPDADAPSSDGDVVGKEASDKRGELTRNEPKAFVAPSVSTPADTKSIGLFDDARGAPEKMEQKSGVKKAKRPKKDRLDSVMEKLDSSKENKQPAFAKKRKAKRPPVRPIGRQDSPDTRREMMQAFSAKNMQAMKQQGASQSEMEESATSAMLRKFGDPNRIRELQSKAMGPKPPPEPEEQLDGFANRVVHGERIVSKPMTETSVDPKSTFSIDVDTGAYALARARLRQGYRPKSEDVRIEEFLNYFHYDYPEPVAGEFSVHLEGAPDPFATAGNRHLIRIGVKGKAVPEEKRPPAHLTFLVDVSGSMFGPDKLGLAIEALDLVSRGLRADDTVAIVTYAKGAKVRLWPAGATERDLASTAIAGLEPGGSSSLDDGLKLAYEVASTHFNAGHVNRVVLLSDGRANVGETDPEVLLRAAQAGVEDGVMLSTIGFGAKAFNDRMMEKLADNGSGSYFFVDSFREAQKVFRDQLCGTIFAIAEDVKIQVEFDRNSVVRHRLLGYENRKLEHKEFRDDAVDAGEIGAGHSVTALYEVELLPSPAPVIASVSIRHKRPGERQASETNFQLLAGELNPDVRTASVDFKFAAAVALFAQILRGEEPGNSARLSLVKEIASEGVLDAAQQPDRAEFLALVDEAAPYYAD